VLIFTVVHVYLNQLGSSWLWKYVVEKEINSRCLQAVALRLMKIELTWRV